MSNSFLNIYKSLLALAMLAVLTGCSDAISNIFGDGEIEQGEKVQFTTMVPDLPATTRSAYDVWKTKVDAYKAVQHDYTFTVEMWKDGADAATSTNTYTPKQTTDVGATVISDYDGTLQAADGKTEMYWEDNKSAWGFKAEANNNTLVSDQNSQEKWLKMDYLKGHSYLPLWTGDNETGAGTDPEVIQYKTNKQWYKANQDAKALSGLMVESNEDYKKIPLYMKHQRSWITVILKAGEGVKREALQFATSAQNIEMTINSYEAGATAPLAINGAWAKEEIMHYEADKNGGEANVSTTRYDAIVMPHNYATKKDEEIIARINLSGQHFSFYAGNDNRFLAGASEADQQQALNDYNLEAGKHLTIVATLSRESRKILITAWIEDWTEVATSTICDDYGQNGDPIVIKSKNELIDFLSNSSLNKQGSVGIIQPTELDLDAVEPWTGDYDLNATLNLAGCVLKTKHRLLNNMSPSANLVNGTIEIGDEATVDCAIANVNNGTIERINVTMTSEHSTAKATVAGMVKENHGTIYQCSSELTVYGTAGQTMNETKYVGGIAAVSLSPSESSMAVIDGCKVNASVNGAENVHGGGIVGYTTGRVSNNTFEYGITYSQNQTTFKNIFAQAGSGNVRAYGNGWPTKVTNPINSDATNINAYTGDKFDAVLDSQTELDMIMNNSSDNVTNKYYRISKSFTVSSNTWQHGVKNDDYASTSASNVSFHLDGNNKTITLNGNKEVKTTDGTSIDNGNATTYTTAPMLFCHVLGEVKNLTLYLEKPIVAEPSVNEQKIYVGDDAIAPLAYAVYGASGKLTNIKVKGADGAYVQSCTPAGLVTWAYGGATISECKVNIPVRMWLPSEMGNDAKHYAGGIVACAGKATIKQCQYLGNSEISVSGSQYSTSAKNSANYFYGGIVGGTSKKGSEEPSLQIIDCSSWFIAKRATDIDTDKSSKGAIIAYTQYSSTAQSLPSGMDTAHPSQGNWWQLSAIGAHSWAPGLTEEKVIGKKNSVTPTYDTNF